MYLPLTQTIAASPVNSFEGQSSVSFASTIPNMHPTNSKYSLMDPSTVTVATASAFPKTLSAKDTQMTWKAENSGLNKAKN